MKRYAKIGAVLLCLCLLLGMMPLGVFAGGSAGSGVPVYAVTVEGGTVTFVCKDEIFIGTASLGDVLEISLAEQDGRTFKRWESLSGALIPDQDFRMLVGSDEIIWAVFTDTDDCVFGPWQLVRAGNCEEGSLYRAVNSKGDVKYKIEYSNGGWHDFGQAVYVDEDHHKEVCTVCGFEREEEHSFGSEAVVKEATHAEEGLKRATCYGCGATVDVTIPRTEEHVYDGTWTIVEPSEGGQPGKRSRKCLYCDHTETYWYMDIDYKPIFKNHYMEYYDTYGGKKCHNERYYSYVDEEGRDVYVMALQYVYAYSSGNDGGTTWIWTYIDDGDDTTLDPIYLSRSYGETMSAYSLAHYGYVYNFDGYLKAIKNPDFVTGNCNGMILGNAMSARASALLSWTNDWVEEYNSMMIPADRDPYEGFITTTGEFKRWEANGNGHVASTSVYQGKDEEENDIYDYVGGFPDCTHYKKCVIDYGDDDKTYDHCTIDNETGMMVNKTIYTTAYTTSDYFYRYREIISRDEYDALDEQYQSAYMCVDQIEANIKSFCSERNSFGGFTLTVPERPTAVRLLVNESDWTSDLVTISGNGQVTSPSYNNGHVFWTPNDPANPDNRKITLSWNQEKAGSKVFDRWERWSFAEAAWKTIGTAETLTLNTYGDPLLEVTFIRPIYHENQNTHHITVNGGYFYINDESSEEYTEADVPDGSYIYLYYSTPYPDGKTPDHWVDQNGVTYDYYKQEVTADRSYTAVYRDVTYWIAVEAYEGIGTVWAVGDEENADTYYSAEASLGSTVSFVTAGDEENGYSEFLGWYLKTWGKGEDTRYTLLTKDLTYQHTVEGDYDGQIVAVWTDGTVSLETPRVAVRVLNGFAQIPSGWGGELGKGGIIDKGGKEEPILIPDSSPGEAPVFCGPSAYSALLLTSYSDIMLYDDPSDGKGVIGWLASWTDSEAEQLQMIDLADSSFFAQDVTTYVTGEILITGILPCGDGRHNYGEWLEPEGGEPYHYQICSVCGDVHIVADDMAADEIRDTVTTAGAVVIDASAVEGRTGNTVEVPVGTVGAAASEAADDSSPVENLTVVVADNTSVSYDADALQGIFENANNAGAASVSVTVNEVWYDDAGANENQQQTFQAQAAVDSGTTIYQVAIAYTVDNGDGTTSTGEISDFNGGQATVTVPYGEEVGDGEEVVVDRVEEDGRKTEVDSQYSEEDATVSFTTCSHSYYMISKTLYRHVKAAVRRTASRRYTMELTNRVESAPSLVFLPQYDEDGRMIDISLEMLAPSEIRDIVLNAVETAEAIGVIMANAALKPLQAADSIDVE